MCESGCTLLLMLILIFVLTLVRKSRGVHSLDTDLQQLCFADNICSQLLCKYSYPIRLAVSLQTQMSHSVILLVFAPST